MNTLKDRRLAFAGLVMLVASALLGGPFLTSTHGQGGSAPVTVINTSERPVPVTGTLTLGETVLSEQSGVWTVGISGTPTVLIDNSNPVNITEQEFANRQPFQRFMIENLQPGEFINHLLPREPVEFLVPAGKRLVIEHVSGVASVAPGQKVSCDLITTVAAGTSRHFVMMFPVGTFGFGTADSFIASQPMRLYADPGTAVRLLTFRNATDGVGSFNVSVSGYLVDAP